MCSSKGVCHKISSADDEERKGEEGGVARTHIKSGIRSKSTPIVSQSKKVECETPLPLMKCQT